MPQGPSNDFMSIHLQQLFNFFRIRFVSNILLIVISTSDLVLNKAKKLSVLDIERPLHSCLSQVIKPARKLPALSSFCSGSNLRATKMRKSSRLLHRIDRR